MEELIARLRKCPLMKALDSKDIRSLLEKINYKVASYSKGQTLTRLKIH